MTRPELTRQEVHHARTLLTHDELTVWLAWAIQHLGRRTGSLALGISEETWRYRLRNARQKLDTARNNAA